MFFQVLSFPSSTISPFSYLIHNSFKVPVLKYKTVWRFMHQNVMNNKTCIHEKMVNLNKFKKAWTKFATKSSWNEKNAKKSAI